MLLKKWMFYIFMTDGPSLFTGFKINNYYKYLLYLCGIIFILSLFLEVKGLNQAYVRHISFWVIVVSLGIWLMDTMLDVINTNSFNSIGSTDGLTDKEYRKKGRILFRLNYGIQIVAWISLFSFLFML